jgi:hypothetical protein
MKASADQLLSAPAQSFDSAGDPPQLKHGPFQLIARVHEVYGAELLGPLLFHVSICIHVLSVLLLAHWSDL